MIKWIKKIFKKRIKYTEEMRIQDSLWEDGKEDFAKMLILRKEILENARKLGWNGFAINYEYDGNEVLTDVYLNKEIYDSQKYDIDGFETFGNCRGLIKYLENNINIEERKI